MSKYTGSILVPNFKKIVEDSKQTYNRAPEEKKKQIHKTRVRRENIARGQIAAGRQRTLDEQKKCVVCDERKSESSFVRPCGYISLSCRQCRTGATE